MSSLIKIRMMCSANIENKPKLGYKYTLVFIRGYNLAECLGNEATGEFYIYDGGIMVGSNKNSSDRNCLRKYRMVTMKNELDELKLSDPVKIGYFEVKKITVWGRGRKYYSIHGSPIFTVLSHDHDTEKFQQNLDKKINKYGWADYINEDK